MFRRCDGTSRSSRSVRVRRRKEIGEGRQRFIHQRRVSAHVMQGAVLILDEQSELSYDVELRRRERAADGRSARESGEENNQSLEQCAQHLSLNGILRPEFILEHWHQRVQSAQVVRVRGDDRRAMRSVEQQSDARDFAVVIDNAIEIAIESPKHNVGGSFEAVRALGGPSSVGRSLRRRQVDLGALTKNEGRLAAPRTPGAAHVRRSTASQHAGRIKPR